MGLLEDAKAAKNAARQNDGGWIAEQRLRQRAMFAALDKYVPEFVASIVELGKWPTRAFGKPADSLTESLCLLRTYEDFVTLRIVFKDDGTYVVSPPLPDFSTNWDPAQFDDYVRTALTNILTKSL